MNIAPFLSFLPVLWILGLLLAISLIVGTVNRVPFLGRFIIRLIACFICLQLAALMQDLQEAQTARHSPVIHVQGSVDSQQHRRWKSGKYGDRNDETLFQVRLADHSLTPQFIISDVKIPNPSFARGDAVAVDYRAWDNVLVSIHVIQGQSPGWTYTPDKSRIAWLWTTCVLAFNLILGAVIWITWIGMKRKAARSA